MLAKKDSFMIVQPLQQITPNMSEESNFQVSTIETQNCNMNELQFHIESSVAEVMRLTCQVNRQMKTMAAIKDNLEILKSNQRQLYASQ